MSKAIVKLYYRLVKSGSRNLEDLDEELAAAVQEMIDEETTESESGSEDAE